VRDTENLLHPCVKEARELTVLEVVVVGLVGQHEPSGRVREELSFATAGDSERTGG